MKHFPKLLKAIIIGSALINPDDITDAEFYDITGRRISEPVPGLVIVRLSVQESHVNSSSDK